jgi:hypothetical protein
MSLVVFIIGFVPGIFIIFIIIGIVVSVVWLGVWLRIRLRRLGLRIRRRRLRSGRWAGVWLRWRNSPGQIKKAATTAALRASYGQRERQARLDVRRAGSDGQDQEKVFHFGSHRLLSAKCSCRLPSCASSVGLPFLRPLEPCEM